VKLVSAVHVAVLSASLVAGATVAEAKRAPTPEQVQAWATTLPRQPKSALDPVYSPIAAIHVLDQIYAVMVQGFSENRPADAWTKGDEGSKAVDRYRRLLVHSPDKNLNRLMTKALNQVGDVFDEVNITETETAAKKAPRSNRLWAQVQATMNSYGVDTGESWSLSTAN
jgi:hypothetical protein